MKKSNLFKALTLTVVGLGLLASQATAATLSYARGDLLLGFTTTGAGSSFDYVVNLGQASLYRDATSAFQLSINGIDADLDSIFGNDWNTRSDVFWGVFGTRFTSAGNGDVAATIYNSKAQEVIGVHGTGYGRGSQSAQAAGNGPGGQIHNAGSGFANGINSTANNAVGSIQTLPQTNSFASFITNGGVTAFSAYDNALGNFGNGATGTALDLFRQAPAGGSTGVALGTPGDLLGTFTINGAGQLTFTPVAVPEPSTYGLIIGAAAILFIVVRRRKNSPAA